MRIKHNSGHVLFFGSFLAFILYRKACFYRGARLRSRPGYTKNSQNEFYGYYKAHSDTIRRWVSGRAYKRSRICFKTSFRSFTTASRGDRIEDTKGCQDIVIHYARGDNVRFFVFLTAIFLYSFYSFRSLATLAPLFYI